MYWLGMQCTLRARERERDSRRAVVSYASVFVIPCGKMRGKWNVIEGIFGFRSVFRVSSCDTNSPLLSIGLSVCVCTHCIVLYTYKGHYTTEQKKEFAHCKVTRVCAAVYSRTQYTENENVGKFFIPVCTYAYIYVTL